MTFESRLFLGRKNSDPVELLFVLVTLLVILSGEFVALMVSAGAFVTEGHFGWVTASLAAGGVGILIAALLPATVAQMMQESSDEAGGPEAGELTDDDSEDGDCRGPKCKKARTNVRTL